MKEIETKKRYAAPQLAVHGKVAELTASGTAGQTENAGQTGTDRVRPG